MPALTEIWSCAASAYVGKARALDNNGKWKPPKIIQEPCACLYGTTAPGVLFDGMSEADFEDGSIPRYLAFISETRPEFVAKPAIAFPGELQRRLVGALLMLGISSPDADAEGDRLAGPVRVQATRLVEETGDAGVVFDSLEELKREKLLLADRGDNALYLWGKAVENARRVALTVAALRRPELPRVETKDAEYAANLVTCAVGDMVAFVRDNVATTKAARIKRDLLKCIRRNGGEIEKSELTLLTRQHSRNDRNDAIDDLLDAGQIEIAAARGTGAKAVTVYRLAKKWATGRIGDFQGDGFGCTTAINSRMPKSGKQPIKSSIKFSGYKVDYAPRFIGENRRKQAKREKREEKSAVSV